MVRSLPRVAFVLGLVVLALYVGHEFDRWVMDAVHHPARMYVATADIPIDSDTHGVTSSIVCAPRSLGGIKAGTPMMVRSEGPRNMAVVEFEVMNMHPPLREVAPTEAVALRKAMLCP